MINNILYPEWCGEDTRCDEVFENGCPFLKEEGCSYFNEDVECGQALDWSV